jgi:hypothetical protein
MILDGEELTDILTNISLSISNLNIDQNSTNEIINELLISEDLKENYKNLNNEQRIQIREHIVRELFTLYPNLEIVRTLKENILLENVTNAMTSEAIILNPNLITIINIHELLLSSSQVLYLPLNIVENSGIKYTFNIGNDSLFVKEDGENSYEITGSITTNIKEYEELDFSNYYFIFNSIIIVSVVPIINFKLSTFDSNINMGLLGTMEESVIPTLDSSVNAIIEVSLENIKKIFQFQTDSIDITNESQTDIKYFVNSSLFPRINPANAFLDPEDSLRWIASGDSRGSYAPNKLLVCHDFVRYLAKKLFNTHHGVDLFNNEAELVKNIRDKCETITLSNIINILESLDISNNLLINFIDVSGVNLYYTTNNDISGNVTKIILEQMISIDKRRFKNIENTDFPQPIPFKIGDTIDFRLLINPDSKQHELTNVAPIESRAFRIKYKIVDSPNNIVL